jgi:hypothetical protein
MYRKYLLAAALVATFAAPSFAATAAAFYVQQDATTHKCSVATTKPDGTKLVMIGKVTYTTQADADAAMKAAKECK